MFCREEIRVRYSSSLIGSQMWIESRSFQLVNLSWSEQKDEAVEGKGYIQYPSSNNDRPESTCTEQPSIKDPLTPQK